MCEGPGGVEVLGLQGLTLGMPDYFKARLAYDFNNSSVTPDFSSMWTFYFIWVSRLWKCVKTSKEVVHQTRKS